MNGNPNAAFHVMLKPVGPTCNLGCEYCYYLDKRAYFPEGSPRMSDELLEEFTRQYLLAQPGAPVEFSWQGGEPLLAGRDFFERALALQRKYAPAGTQVRNALQTNGVLLDDDWCRFLAAHGFLVGVSVDGPRELHDRFRRDKAGRSVFPRLLSGIAALHRHRVEFNILSCISAANADSPLRVYRFLRDRLKARFVQFIPVVKRPVASHFAEGTEVTPHSISAESFGRFLITVFDEWARRDIGRVFVQHFDVALSAWFQGRAGLCVHEETCGKALVLEHNGDLYSCDHFVEPGGLLGRLPAEPLLALVRGERQQRFGDGKRDKLPAVCLSCAYRFACQGGCPKDRIWPTDEPGKRRNHLCAGYLAFFEHIDQPMRWMAELLGQERPPAEIMARMKKIARKSFAV